MTVKVYKDQDAGAVFIENSNGVQFLNSLQATMDDPSDVVINVKDLSKDIQLFSDVPFGDFVDHAGASYGYTALEVCNALNAEFSSTGSSQGVSPVITSNTTVNLTEGDTLNYTLTATNGVGYEWDNLPSGVVNVEGNLRKIIGGSNLEVGSYNITAKAVNYFGEDTETISLVVSSPPYSNTKSVKFQNQDYMGANAALLSSVLGRTSDGSGSSDAWSISLWFKGSTSTNNGQNILYFGDNDTTNGGHVRLRYQGNNERLQFQYGSVNNYLRFQSANNSVPNSSWHHIVVTYDGSSTGSSSGNLTSYYNRFKIFVDGVNIVSSGFWSHSNYGYSASVDADNLRVGRYTSGSFMQNGCKVDEMAIWNSDQSSNISNIYNSGSTLNLSGLTAPPIHWWRMGDGDTYPTIQDNVGSAHFVMYNMTAADIVTDSP